jgi:hypothetical protein
MASIVLLLEIDVQFPDRLECIVRLPMSERFLPIVNRLSSNGGINHNKDFAWL